jgi:hypothetical protein
VGQLYTPARFGHSRVGPGIPECGPPLRVRLWIELLTGRAFLHTRSRVIIRVERTGTY